MDDTTWQAFGGRLAGYLATMTDPGEQDHLLLEMPVQAEGGCAPYAQVAAFGSGEMLRVEVSANQYLAPAFEPNYVREIPISQAARAADAVVAALRDQFQVPDPGLLTCQAWGPAAAGVEVLGLTPTDEMVVETAPALGFPDDVEQLTRWVLSALRERLGEEPTVDSDGDVVLHHCDQPLWVRHTAVEIGLLDRDHAWVKRVLRDHDVWQNLLIPGRPFSAELLGTLLDTYFTALSSTRDDLALRTSGRAA